MLGPQEQKQMPYAAYSGHDILVAYANESMKHEDKMMSMRGNNRPFMRNVVPHELIPGHHLQRYVFDRSRPWRELFFTPFCVEGWALHWEMLLWDRGYGESPEDRAGMLFWRMHRCARIVFSLRFHLGLMKAQECVDFLVDRVGHEKFGATSEVRRFIKGDYSPLYQCGYMIGGLQLNALRKEVTGASVLYDYQYFKDRNDEASKNLVKANGETSDILDVIKTLTEIRNGRGTVDDIDHLGNRRVRSVGEMAENVFRVGLVRVEKYFEGTNITAYAGPPPEAEAGDYCWGGCPGAIEEAIEILRGKVDQRMARQDRQAALRATEINPIDAIGGDPRVTVHGGERDHAGLARHHRTDGARQRRGSGAGGIGSGLHARAGRRRVPLSQGLEHQQHHRDHGRGGLSRVGHVTPGLRRRPHARRHLHPAPSG